MRLDASKLFVASLSWSKGKVLYTGRPVPIFIVSDIHPVNKEYKVTV